MVVILRGWLLTNEIPRSTPAHAFCLIVALEPVVYTLERMEADLLIIAGWPVVTGSRALVACPLRLH